jgi:hypothetical protein
MDTSYNLEQPSLHHTPLITEWTPLITYNAPHYRKDTPQIPKLPSLQHRHIIRSTVPTKGWGSRYKLPGPGGLEGHPEPDYVAHVFVFVGSVVICQLYKLILSDNAQVTLQMTVFLV